MKRSKRRFTRKQKKLAKRYMKKKQTYFFRRFAIGQADIGLSTVGEYFGNITVSGLTSVDFLGVTWQMYNNSEFSNLFDYYKLHSVDFFIIPMFNSSDVTASTGYLPTMYWFYDTNDNGTPTLQEMVQRQNVKSRRMDKPFRIRLYPFLQGTVYNTAITSAYVRTRPRWINMTNLATPHYGIKYAIKGQSSDAMSIQVKVRWNFWCKDVK